MSQGLVDHCLELLAPLGAARSRRMFGGFGLYVDDLFVALIAAHRLYLKTDTLTCAHFQAAGGANRDDRPEVHAFETWLLAQAADTRAAIGRRPEMSATGPHG